jgi:hypothetical protein
MIFLSVCVYFVCRMFCFVLNKDLNNEYLKLIDSPLRRTRVHLRYNCYVIPNAIVHIQIILHFNLIFLFLIEIEFSC